MRLQKIDFVILLQVVLLAVTPVLFSLIVESKILILTRLSLIVIWLVQIIFLFAYLRRSEKNLRQAVEMISIGDDFHLLRREELSNVHDGVLMEINEVISRFRNLKLEKEADLLLFNKIIENIPVGILVCDEKANISMVNSTVLDLLGLESLRRLEQLDRVKKDLSLWFKNIEDNNSSVLELDRPDRSIKLSVSSDKIIVLDQELTVYTLKDIKREVDDKEMETWHTMLRIVSHEVVNSVSPITLSSKSMHRNVNKLKEKLDRSDDSDQILSELETGLEAISERGRGLNEFVESIQSLTRVPKPNCELITADIIGRESAGLMHNKLSEQGIELSTDYDNFKVFCDKNLIVQVIINLIKNSMEACIGIENAKIYLSVKKGEGQTQIKVEDNGPGIPEDMKQQIFSPFFSTKERGSGLGLSFSRCVINLHHGDISLWSNPGRTIITVSIPEYSSV